MPISTEEIATLDRVRRLAEGAGVFSVYMALEPSRNVEHAHLPEMTRLIREVEADLDEEEAAAFRPEAERCLDFMRNQFEPAGRTLLIFSSLPRDLWLTMQIQAELPSGAHFGSRPFFLPLAAEPTLERRVVLTIDSEDARLITTRLGEVESEGKIEDYVPRGTRQLGRKHQGAGLQGQQRSEGGTPSYREDESLEEWVLEHYRNVREALDDLQEERPFDRIAIGATGENATRLINMLHEQLASRVAGTFPAEQWVASRNLVEQASEVFRAKRDAEDRESIEAARDMALAGGQGSLGWDDTLWALQQGQVMRLLLSQDAGATGKRCDQGHYVGTQAETCPVCGQELREVSDLPAFAARLAEDTDARVSYVSPAASEGLAEWGGVAALLRY